jgi:hypothetical protein
LDITKDSQTMTAFRNRSAEFVRHLKETRRPMVLTVNGRASIGVRDAESYQPMRHIAAAADAREGIGQGLEDKTAGRGRPAKAVFGDLRRAFDIPV